MTTYFSSKDRSMMEEALLEAGKAFKQEEVPIGAVLALEGKIVARAHNQVETTSDPTAHAEILCIKRGAKALGTWRLLGATLYTTLEPCAMCGGAMLLARLMKVIWGAPDKRHGSHGGWVDLFGKKHPTHQLDIVGGLYEKQAADLMRCFFKRRRTRHEKKQSCFGKTL